MIFTHRTFIRRFLYSVSPAQCSAGPEIYTFLLLHSSVYPLHPPSLVASATTEHSVLCVVFAFHWCKTSHSPSFIITHPSLSASFTCYFLLFASIFRPVLYLALHIIIITKHQSYAVHKRRTRTISSESLITLEQHKVRHAGYILYNAHQLTHVTELFIIVPSGVLIKYRL